MRSVVTIWMMVLSACMHRTETTGQPSLLGNWLFANQETHSGVGLSFGDGASYSVTTLALTSSNTANAEIETGTATVDNGNITFHPQQWSCPGPDPAYTDRYAFNGEALAIASSTGVIQLDRNPETGSGVPFTIVIGCIHNGAFTPHPLGPISN